MIMLRLKISQLTMLRVVPSILTGRNAINARTAASVHTPSLVMARTRRNQ